LKHKAASLAVSFISTGCRLLVLMEF